MSRANHVEHGRVETHTCTSPTGLPVRSTGAVGNLLLRSIEWYQRGAEGRPSPCRFFPSCSAYAHESITVHGTGRGTWLMLRRLLRCRPLGPSGVDLVPPPHGARHESRSLAVAHTPSHPVIGPDPAAGSVPER